MAELVNITSTSNRSADVEKEYPIEETGNTRRILRAKIVKNLKDPQAGVRVTFVHQRRSPMKEWEDYPTWALSHVRAGEQVKLGLGCSETKALLDALLELKSIQEEAGIPWGTREVLVADPGDVLVKDSISPEKLELLAQEQPVELLKVLRKHAPEEVLRRLGLGELQQAREMILTEFEAMMEQDLPESRWQDFLDVNQWIFGYGLRYQVLRPITGQPQYGGANVSGRGGQRGDNLMATEGAVHFTVLVEIKKPQTRLTSDRRAYRNGAWLLGAELLGAVSQVQANCQMWERKALDHENRHLEREDCYTREPKGILVIGSLEELQGDDDAAHVKRSTFESFRRNLHNPEVITFDELFARARFIVRHGADAPSPEPQQEVPNALEDDLPF
jgi:hypothetical protein